MTTTVTRPTHTVTVPYSKETWIAEIHGPHGRYGLDRRFLEGKTNKSAGTVTLELAPGWYEYQEEPGRRVVLAVDSTGHKHTLPHPGNDRDRLRPLGKAAKRGGLIDTPGEYGSARCWCDRPAVGPAPAGSRAEGRGRCADHMPPPADEPPPPPVYDPDPDALDNYEPAPDIPADWYEEGRTA